MQTPILKFFIYTYIHKILVGFEEGAATCLKSDPGQEVARKNFNE